MRHTRRTASSSFLLRYNNYYSCCCLPLLLALSLLFCSFSKGAAATMATTCAFLTTAATTTTTTSIASRCSVARQRRQQQQQQLLSGVDRSSTSGWLIGSSSSLPSLSVPLSSRRRQQRQPIMMMAASSSSDIVSDNNNNNRRVPKEWQGSVLQQLKNVIDPDLGSDIVTLGFVQNMKLIDQQQQDEQQQEGKNVVIEFDVELTTPACPVKDQFAEDCRRLVLDLPWVDDVRVTMTSQPVSTQDTDTSGMAQVNAVVAVSSCKGGVGKSTTAVNLAFSLQRLGASVGILDADVFGPSLPTMVTPDDDVVRFVGRQIAPLQRNGVRLMSFGYVNEGPAVMRGPMVAQLLDQFMSVTNWGTLDYLILDMPPGTGDIQLTLTQRLNITAAVIVTTPQELSFADVVRGIEMFDSVSVPSVAVVENMAYYEPPPNRAAGGGGVDLDEARLKQAITDKLLAKEDALGLNGDGAGVIDRLADELVEVVLENAASASPAPSEKIRIFGPGHKERLSEQWGIEHTFSMPLRADIAANGDNGTPFVLDNPDSEQAEIYLDLARSVVSEVAKAKYSDSRPVVSYDEDRNVISIRKKDEATEDSTETEISSADLRRGCRCAACVEEMTGRQILAASDVSESIKPLKMVPTGNYALSVDWSDGHRSLYPYRQIRSLIQAKKDTGSAVREKATL